MNLAHTIRRALPGTLRDLRFTSRINMPHTQALYTSASLKAANATPFSTLKGKLDPALLEGLDAMGFDYMTPVQRKLLGGLPSLRSDCLVQAKTGTGKTIAFLLLAIHSLLTHSPPRGQVAVLILSPTRELALQIAAEALLVVSKVTRPLEIHTAFGGTKRESNLNKFMNGDPKILVATPGRLNDYLSESKIREKFGSMQALILDEADAMLEAGFLPDIVRILQALPPKDEARWQGMCFSATIPPKIKQVLSNVLNEDYTTISTLDSSEPPTLAAVQQHSIVIPSARDTFNALLSTINLEIAAGQEDSKIIVFGTTANLVALYVKLFKDQTKLQVFELHSRLAQSQRTRATSQFKEAKSGIMFATDVIGRGMDFPDVTLVVQVGLPSNADAYTHRVGRTARAGKDGRAIILLTEAESYFIQVNRQFPISTHARSTDILEDKTSARLVSQAMGSIDEDSKRKAYSAYLGFMKPFINKLKLDLAGLVRMANELALDGMKCGEIPEMKKTTVGKMGLKGVPGLRYEKPDASVQKRVDRKSKNVDNGYEDGRFKRAKHQGPPEMISHATNRAEFSDDDQGGQNRGGGHGLRGARGARGALVDDGNRASRRYQFGTTTTREIAN